MKLGTTAPEVALPMEVSQPGADLLSYTMLIYGAMKIGKTSLFQHADRTLYLMFEPGGKGLSIYQMAMTSWSVFKSTVALLEQDDRFGTIVIDTVDIAYTQCLQSVCRARGIDHPTDANDYGKTWSAVKGEFSDTIGRLASLGKGVVFLSHAEVSTFERERGGSYDKLVPTVPRQALTFLTGFVDLIGYYGYVGDDRYLVIHGSDAIEAGHRVEGKFRVVGEGDASEDVYAIPMGSSSLEAWEAFNAAYNNEQEESYIAEVGSARAVLADRKKKRGTGK